MIQNPPMPGSVDEFHRGVSWVQKRLKGVEKPEGDSSVRPIIKPTAHPWPIGLRRLIRRPGNPAIGPQDWKRIFRAYAWELKPSRIQKGLEKFVARVSDRVTPFAAREGWKH